MKLYGVHALVIILDTWNIVCPWAPHIALKTDPLKTMTVNAIPAIVVVLTLEATLVIVVIAEIPTASQMLVTARAKVTILNTETIQDHNQDHDQGPVCMILETQDMIMATLSNKMITGEGTG